MEVGSRRAGELPEDPIAQRLAPVLEVNSLLQKSAANPRLAHGLRELRAGRAEFIEARSMQSRPGGGSSWTIAR
jgi:hypothetical protein